ncbi:hypothetical protein [Glycomyces sp. MUSA5-2]|uniref:hypothetical protein n=1 Tax=Glycomyces sp. MUSA5-2 TaxID=2053002 RepID=UPI00300B87A0
MNKPSPATGQRDSEAAIAHIAAAAVQLDRDEQGDRETIIAAATDTLQALLRGLRSDDPDQRHGAEQDLAALVLAGAVRDADTARGLPWDFNAVPYARAVLEVTDTVLDTRFLNLAGTGPVTFEYWWEKRYTRTFDRDELSPGWEQALLHPGKCTNAANRDLDNLLGEDLGEHYTDEDSQRVWCRVTTDTPVPPPNTNGTTPSR